MLLGGLQMIRTNGKELHARTTTEVSQADWGHPIGKAVAFVPEGDVIVRKAFPGAAEDETIRKIGGSAMLNVAYHPSGLALAVIQTANAGEEIWITTNLGEDIKRLVFSVEGTRFGEIEFSSNGTQLFYSAQHSDDRPYVHVIDLTAPSEAPSIWRGEVATRVLDMAVSPDADSSDVAVTTGTSCEDQRSIITTPDGDMDLGPVQVVGWLDPMHVLTAKGCVGEEDVSVFDLGTGSSADVVSGVEVSASRALYPVPAAGLPMIPGAGAKEPESGVG